MNSISFLDSVLTRSLTTSRSGSGSATPAHPDNGLSLRGGEHNLNRRASDYSLSREREREKRRVAASLGLTSLEDGDVRSHRRHSKQSRRSSRSTSEDEKEPRKQEADASNGRTARSAHPKSSSETQASTAADRQRLKRTGSTPVQLRPPATSRRWGSLWGFGGFLEETHSIDSYARRSSSVVGPSSSRMSRSSSADPSTAAFASPRRASTGDADAAAVHNLAPHALLSEREREDVVDFEGCDPDDDLNGSSFPQTPPSTPYRASVSMATPTDEPSRRTSGVGDTNAALGTGSRLSSLLFGALNPLTDDYFGPQPAKRPPSLRQPRRRSSDGQSTGGSSGKRAHTREESQASKDSLSDSTGASMDGGESHGKAAVGLPSMTKEQTVSALPESNSAERLPLDPPPPYTDLHGTSHAAFPASSSIATSSAKRTRRRRISSLIVRGAKNTFEILRRLLLMILLGPYRAYQHIKGSSRRRQAQVSAQGVAEVCEALPAHALRTAKFHTPSQAARPSAARHTAGVRDVERTAKLDGVNKDSDSESEDVVTEDQAAERAARRARREEAWQRDAALKSSGATNAPRQPLSSRLLPNPNPIDPLLAHDRDAEKRTFEENQQEEERQRQLQMQRKTKQAQASGRVAVVNRGPTSMLIHHSPKVLVLDLDETLIHSTSRSPTWSALADRSKSRVAVTTGSSLLGFDGLGGVLGLRGQVGVRPHQVEVVLDGRSLIYHVYKRPHVETFLRKVAAWYHVVVFTASVQEYADPVIDWLDQGRGLISGRLYREACTYRNGSYLKNLAHVDADLSRVCLVDNSPASYAINQANGIPIEGWTHDPHDEALLDLLPVLDSLRFASDVRHVLGVRGFSA